MLVTGPASGAFWLAGAFCATRDGAVGTAGGGGGAMDGVATGNGPGFAIGASGTATGA